jgi:hypothetical protein
VLPPLLLLLLLLLDDGAPTVMARCWRHSWQWLGSPNACCCRSQSEGLLVVMLLLQLQLMQGLWQGVPLLTILH